MESKNGYFKLDIKEVGVFLQVYPPEEGGKPLEYKEVLSYLEERGYGKIDLKELNRVIALNEGMQEIYLDVSFLF